MSQDEPRIKRWGSRSIIFTLVSEARKKIAENKRKIISERIKRNKKEDKKEDKEDEDERLQLLEKD